MSKNLCIIPARGGSKRIPRKNIKDFLGKPIIAYSIEAALECGIFDEVMVSTEDKEIASIAEKYGAKVPFYRSQENANDFAGTVDVLLEVIEQYKNLDRIFDNICCIYPTAPFTTKAKLIKSYNKLRNENFDTVLPLMPFSYPIQRALRISDNCVSFYNPEFEKYRSQDLERAFHDAGQFYFLKTEEFIKNKTIFSKNSGGVLITEVEAQDIDNEVDWKIAEIKYEFIQNS